ncbi:DHA2 family efflux MFS transporter permease subunit [Chitinophaga pinensis]|uniref:Drug resistance transporter, EmrB/QacA subfamily n=1 Tax=Chitinophaga pinensis (strain ATCC 43595 / DSM 2588 / LMG 13176 / NBRC 15968 / NCIMB 11800 / UQM 2034) TaxID=485918 RepID=A0A979G3E8_CHIPD|nr:DHA2 family efflux MFS transporter permease subunit [Chitinophaga pinensis]ACU59971.1 drug resistance transporter, EmrB/QacA subfamily [Chitinophaga pinensis DSM 2588]
MEKSASFTGYGFRHACITLIAFICVLVAVMNCTVTNVAFNEIRGNLGVSLDEVSWVTTVYVLAYIAIIPFSNWLSRKLGNKKYLIITLILFIVSSFLCGNATSIEELLILRFLQGLGGGAMLVLSHTMILENWPPQRRTTAQAFFILGMLGGNMLAAPFGGYITDNYTWSYIFYPNILVGILLCILVLVFVENKRYQQREDWLGTIMVSIGASCLYLALTRGQQEEWFKSPFIIVLLLCGLVGLVIFIRRELEWITPQGENGLLRNVSLRNGLILAFVAALGIAASSSTITIPLRWHAQLPKISPWLVIVCIILVMALITILIEEKKALKYILAAGPILLIIYNYMVFQQPVAPKYTTYIYYLLAVRILAVILLSISVSTFVFSKLENKEIGPGVRMYHLVQQLGLALGIALFSAFTYKAPEPDYTRFLGHLDLKDPVVQKAIRESTTSLDQVRAEAFVRQAHDTQVGVVKANFMLMIIAGIILTVLIFSVRQRIKINSKNDSK